jgi:2-amino-4-hydroxy-6-hydroxymethyldihydropteridine diphosphokinase
MQRFTQRARKKFATLEKRRAHCGRPTQFDFRRRENQALVPRAPANSATLICVPLAAIALGSNLASHAGPPEATLAAAADRLASSGRIVARSSLYSTAPVGFVNQPRFVNAVLLLEASLAPRELLKKLLEIERDFGRKRIDAVLNGPRPLDLDLILYGDLVLHESELELPHPRFAERAFVLVPLNEIAPELRDPRTGLAVSQLAARLPEDANAASRIENEHWAAKIFS